jgi:lactoylglutathione lyase
VRPVVRFGYAILYVRDVAASVEFYERAFGLERRLLHESGQYAEMETGATALALAAHELAAENLPNTLKPGSAGDGPPTFEICLVTEEVDAAYERALREGAQDVAAPKKTSWGQEIAYVRDPDGVLVELASPG